MMPSAMAKVTCSIRGQHFSQAKFRQPTWLAAEYGEGRAAPSDSHGYHSARLGMDFRVGRAMPR